MHHFKNSRSFYMYCSYILIAANAKIFTEAGVLPLIRQKLTPDNNPTNSEQQQSNTIAATIAHRFVGYIEYQPNGTIILRSSSLENATNLQNLLLFKAILKAIKIAAPSAAVGQPLDGTQTTAAAATKFDIKIYGDGIEHKFPPFLERIIQRIQTYFSVYRYTDTSHPLPVRLETSTTNTYAANTNTEDNYLTTTIIDIGDVGGGVSGGGVGTGGGHLDLIDDFENTTFIDANADIDGNITGSDDYPEFIEIRENNDFGTAAQD